LLEITRFQKTHLGWRDVRGWFMAQKLNLDKENGFLDIQGTINGSGFSSSELVHLTGIGDFQLVNMMGSLDPNGLHPDHSSQLAQNMHPKVTRDKFCLMRNGDCEENMDLYASKELNDQMIEEQNQFNTNKNLDEDIENQKDDKEIDDFLEINELMAGINLNDDNSQNDMEEDDEIGDLEEDNDEFLQDPE